MAAAERGAHRSLGLGGPGAPSSGDRVREFVRRYGWRAYALPVLVVLTVIGLATAYPSAHAPRSHIAAHPGAGAALHSAAPRNAPTTGHAAPVSGSTRVASKTDSPSGAVKTTAPSGAALPAGGNYTQAGKGTFRVLPGTSKVIGNGPLHRFDIEVENGLSGIDLNQFTALVMQTLSDPRSWAGHGVSLQRVDSGPVDWHITLTTAMTVRAWCGYSVPVETSCYAAAGSEPAATVNRVVLNDARWVRGATAYVGDLTAYRQYMINHEDGHALGHEHAHQCLPGGLAPAMMQQTYGLVSAATRQQCQANPWPYPPGVKGAPGAEQPDTPQNDEYGLGGD